MKVNKCMLLSLLFTGLAWGVATQAAEGGAPVQGNPAAGAVKKSMCAGCHGIADYRTAYPAVYRVPKLGGQHAAYIIQALEEYKSGARSFSDMRAIAASLSQQDIADLAAYYSGGK